MGIRFISLEEYQGKQKKALKFTYLFIHTRSDHLNQITPGIEWNKILTPPYWQSTKIIWQLGEV